MILTTKAIPRRTFLRGMGVAIGLPFMEAMSPAVTSAQAGVLSPPVRLMFLYVPNGMDMENWNPDYSGPLAALPRILKPLEPFRDDMLMLSNLTHNWARGLLDGPGDHGRCSANYLTGSHVVKSDKSIHVDGPMSMDQLIASRIGHETRLQSLEIGMEDPDNTFVLHQVTDNPGLSLPFLIERRVRPRPDRIFLIILRVHRGPAVPDYV